MGEAEPKGSKGRALVEMWRDFLSFLLKLPSVIESLGLRKSILYLGIICVVGLMFIGVGILISDVPGKGHLLEKVVNWIGVSLVFVVVMVRFSPAEDPSLANKQAAQFAGVNPQPII